jgi:hypothetical protein
MAARRWELLGLAVLAACLAAGRGLGLDALAVWAAAGLVGLAPGWFLLRAMSAERELGRAGAAPAAAALSLAVWAPPLALAYAFGLTLTVVLAAVIAATAGLVALVRAPPAIPRAGLGEQAAGAVSVAAFAYVSWRISTPVVGDALFHVGLMRKLTDASGLSFAAVSPFLHGPPNAGYAFPLLHAAFAGIGRLAGTDPVTTFRYLQPACAALAITAAYALAHALTGWRAAGYLAAALTAWDLFSLINGLVMQINQPPPFTLWVLTPAALLLFWLEIRHARRAAPATAAAVAVIAFVHPTYAIPWLAIAAGMLVGAWRAGLPGLRTPLGTLALTTGVTGAVAGWLWAIAIRGGHRHVFLSHADEFVIRSGRAIIMQPWAPVFQRGYVLLAIAALPWLVRYRRTLPIAGAMAGLLALLLIPGVNTAVIRLVGMGQFHRFWQPLPWPAAAAALACAAAVRLGWLSWPVAAVLAVVLHEARGRDLVWQTPASVAVVLALAATVWVLTRRPVRDHLAGGGTAGAVALVVAVLAPYVYHWGPVVRDEAEAGPYRSPPAFETVRLTPGAIRFFRHAPVPDPVVLAQPDRAFELFGFADVRVADLPEARTRALPRLDEAGRNRLEQSFFSPETTPARRAQILRGMRVDYVMLDLRDQPPDVLRRILRDPGLRLVYRDRPDEPSHLGRFAILRVRTQAATAARSAAGSPAGASTA